MKIYEKYTKHSHATHHRIPFAPTYFTHRNTLCIIQERMWYNLNINYNQGRTQRFLVGAGDSIFQQAISTQL